MSSMNITLHKLKMKACFENQRKGYYPLILKITTDYKSTYLEYHG